ncbi:MAG: B12-binding domain-containing radical SAM protein, partial [Pseudomonadota bacterium]|nr:B12-binding domain-containing radical SAM protein [Pseudomonadota bacterium]
MTDLVIINPTAHAQIYQGLSNDYAAFEPPIWAGMLSLAMKHQGFDVELVDCEGLSIGYEDAARLVKDCRPKLVCIPVYGQQPSAST